MWYQLQPIGHSSNINYYANTNNLDDTMYIPSWNPPTPVAPEYTSDYAKLSMIITARQPVVGGVLYMIMPARKIPSSTEHPNGEIRIFTIYGPASSTSSSIASEDMIYYDWATNASRGHVDNTAPPTPRDTNNAFKYPNLRGSHQPNNDYPHPSPISNPTAGAVPTESYCSYFCKVETVTADGYRVIIVRSTTVHWIGQLLGLDIRHTNGNTNKLRGIRELKIINVNN